VSLFLSVAVDFPEVEILFSRFLNDFSHRGTKA
jgi:hypothetical protein